MPRGKLILICQFGGKFVTDNDGNLSYTGGHANAVDINPDTPFDDLKLKLAEMFTLECDSLSMKYFLPGNKRTLISLADNKDLKRMCDFHAQLVTADVFLIGKKGSKRKQDITANSDRAHGKKAAKTVTAAVTSKDSDVTPMARTKRRAKTVNAAVTSKDSDANNKVRSEQPDKTVTAAVTSEDFNATHRPHNKKLAKTVAAAVTSKVSDANHVVMGLSANGTDAIPVQSPGNVATTSKLYPADDVTENSNAARVTSADRTTCEVDPIDNRSNAVDVNGTPADTVKNRRRIASQKLSANALTSSATSGNVGKTRKGKSRMKNKRKYGNVHYADELEQQAEQEEQADGVRKRRKSSRKNSTQDYDLQNNDDAEHEQNIISKYEKVPLKKMLASWKKGITGAGQDFKSVIEFRDALRKYAIAHRFAYKFKKNETNRARGNCLVDGCSWKIYASWVPSEQVFRIKSMTKSHTCGGKSWKSAHPKKSWLVGIIKERLRETPHHKPRHIAKRISQDFGMELDSRQVARGIEDAREQLQGSYKEAYDQLPWFCEKLVEANPGSVVKISVGDDRKFQRLFVSFEASRYGFLNGCRPIIFLDSTTFKSKHHEMLLVATALDADDGLFPISFAVVDVENDENWHWFLEQLKLAVSTSRPITFVSDKEKGLNKAVLEIFENAHHGYSIHHLMECLKRNLKGPGPILGDGKSSLSGSLVAAAQAVRLSGYRMFIEQIKLASQNAYDWLMQIEPEYWTTALFKGEPYNHVTVNIAELYAKWIEEVRELPIVQKLEAFRCRIADLIHKRQLESNGWTSKLTPSKEQKLQEETSYVAYLRVLVSSDELFEVHDESINVVDLGKKHCSCLRWKVTGIPCSHAVAVFNRTKKDAYDFCAKHFAVECYRQTYSKSINPILAIFEPSNGKKVSTEERDVLPPTTPRPPTQPKERVPQKKVRRPPTCKRCNEVGHTKATCKAVL